jgi:hypothetical protein
MKTEDVNPEMTVAAMNPDTKEEEEVPTQDLEVPKVDAQVEITLVETMEDKPEEEGITTQDPAAEVQEADTIKIEIEATETEKAANTAEERLKEALSFLGLMGQCGHLDNLWKLSLIKLNLKKLKKLTISIEKNTKRNRIRYSLPNIRVTNGSKKNMTLYYLINSEKKEERKLKPMLTGF